MPCDSCRDPDRCDSLGICQDFRLTLSRERECTIPNPAQLRAMARPTQPEPCKPGRRCERYARGLGACIAGECNPPADADGVDAPTYGEAVIRALKAGTAEAEEQQAAAAWLRGNAAGVNADAVIITGDLARRLLERLEYAGPSFAEHRAGLAAELRAAVGVKEVPRG